MMVIIWLSLIFNIELLLYLGFVPLAVVFAAVFAGVVLGQLILAELLELVGHCLLQACWQGAAEALEADRQFKTGKTSQD